MTSGRRGEGGGKGEKTRKSLKWQYDENRSLF